MKTLLFVVLCLTVASSATAQEFEPEIVEGRFSDCLWAFQTLLVRLIKVVPDTLWVVLTLGHIWDIYIEDFNEVWDAIKNLNYMCFTPNQLERNAECVSDIFEVNTLTKDLVNDVIDMFKGDFSKEEKIAHDGAQLFAKVNKIRTEC